ncbi:MAG: histidine kinase [Bacteroidales bacterium]|nr:histidine kinase [Bacteroidales bacterium]
MNLDFNMSKKKISFVEIIPLLVWVLITIVPSISSYMFLGTWEGALHSIVASLSWFLPSLILFYINFYLLIPNILYKGETKKFVLINITGFFIYFLLYNLISHFFNEWNTDWNRFFMHLIWTLPFTAIVSVLIVGFAMGLKLFIMRNEQIISEKERQNKRTEAELTWLKNQLNPHFLFNTLNNISCQIYTDPDEAQENLSRLSSLLRYALYETGADLVPIQGEIDFMNDYITLMKLRCSNKTTINVDFKINDLSIKILPLLYISLIENAFKHGISNKSASFVDIQFFKSENSLIFIVKNSNFPKTQEKRSGSGIGIENMKRRLLLAYPNKHKFISELRGDVYYSEVEIFL